MSSHRDDIHITETGSIRCLRIGRIQQSSMYLDAPFDTDFEYPGYLHLPFAVVPDATRVLMIGLGGGSVVKRMWRDYPRVVIDVVEIDERVARFARSHFALPDDERIRVHVGDGRAFLEASADEFDIVIVDAFVEDQVPSHLQTEQFHHAVLARLRDGGVLAYNFHGSVTGDRSKPFRRLHKTLSTAFSRTWVFPVGLSAGGTAAEHREIVTVSANTALTPHDILDRITSRVEGLVTVPAFHLFGEDLYRDGIRTGDVATLIDPPGYTNPGGGSG